MSDRPQRRTVLVASELGRYGIQIAALSETRFADVGEIKEVGDFNARVGTDLQTCEGVICPEGHGWKGQQ